MENKKTVVGIVVVTILIIVLIIISYLSNSFNTKQVKLLTEESNKLLKSNWTEDSIDFHIKTEKNYAVVEKAMKEYISSLKNIYVEMQEMTSGIMPNSIFTAQNVPNKNLNGIDDIIDEYKEKSQKCIAEIEKLVLEEQILENINKRSFSLRTNYYINLYNTIMLSEAMNRQYNKIEEEIKNEKGTLYEKLNKIEKIKEFLEKYKDYWEIKGDKIQFTDSNKTTEYYNLCNQISD